MRAEQATEEMMTFAEIAEVMGITRQAVQQIYDRAIKKLRRHPAQMNVLRAMAKELDKNRQQMPEF